MPTISVYVDTGVVYEYEVPTPEKGREHSHSIVMTGYRHTPQDSDDLEWFPPHRIAKVKVSGAGKTTAYKDTARAT